MRRVRQYIRLNGREFEPTSGEREGQGSLVCCSPLGCKETQLSEEQQQLVYMVYTQFGKQL